MLEIIAIVLLFCNKDGSKKGVINGICIAGLILTILLGIFWSPFYLLDAIVYIVCMLIGNSQGKTK